MSFYKRIGKEIERCLGLLFSTLRAHLAILQLLILTTNHLPLVAINVNLGQLVIFIIFLSCINRWHPNKLGRNSVRR